MILLKEKKRISEIVISGECVLVQTIRGEENIIFSSEALPRFSMYLDYSIPNLSVDLTKPNQWGFWGGGCFTTHLVKPGSRYVLYLTEFSALVYNCLAPKDKSHRKCKFICILSCENPH